MRATIASSNQLSFIVAGLGGPLRDEMNNR